MPERWMKFDELCLELRLSPYRVKKLIKAGRIVGLCFGKPYRYETDWRYVDPSERYKKALSTQQQILGKTYHFDLGEMPLISAREVAALCGFSQNRVRGLVLRKVLSAHKIGKDNYFTANQVRDFIFRRDKIRKKEDRPAMDTILRWAMQYIEKERIASVPLEKAKQDDALESMMQRLMQLREPERSKQIAVFWHRYQLAKDIAEIAKQELT